MGQRIQINMVLSDNQFKDLLVKSKALDDKRLQELYQLSASFRISMHETAIENGILSDEKLGKIIADSLKLPFIQLTKVEIPDNTFRIVPEKIARKLKVIAFSITPTEVKLAMADPNYPDLIDMVAKKTNKKVSVYLATEQDIDATLMIFQKDLQIIVDQLFGENKYNASFDAPVEKIIDTIIANAYHEKASDIHIEPEEDNVVVRFRIDSILQDQLYLHTNLHAQIVTRIKVLASLQTDEHLNPQDGKLRIKVDDEYIDIRVSILPITEGEKIVLRVLSSKFRQLTLADLGMTPKDLKKIAHVVSRDNGLILSTGPTGSGKTTSIYSILKSLNTREKNITTIEDPVEYKIKGVNQFQVNPKTKLSFANGLRSILRQDPNVIFVGEIRDSETASISVNAALTGHLVLSTLHTNDAATALPRLIDMKVEPFLVASTVNVIIAQRLVRKICPSCKIAVKRTKQEMLKNLSEKTLFGNFGKKPQYTLYKGKGCKLCHATGFTGRIGIFEVLEVSESIRRLISLKSDSDVIKKQAIQDGMTTMLEDGLQKVGLGQTTIEEVLRVMKTDLL